MEFLMMLLGGIIDFSNIEDVKTLTVEEKRIEKIESDRLFDEEAKELDNLLNTLLD